MTGVILAGGENKRMGTDKAFLELSGRPLIEHILQVFLAQFDETLVVTNSPERYARYPVRMVTDALTVRGPLTGIYTALLHARTDRCFVTACDMPFPNKRLIAYMLESAGNFDAVVPRPGGLAEPLHAIYHRRLLPLIGKSIEQDELRITRLLEACRVRYLSETEIVHYDPQMRVFKNINTPEEFKEAVCSDSECRN
ncbi:MAG: molybdenum cofactor guanylyltransferase [Nitrospiraceae bacterium]|nr:molybdenum cofactor guanylyltransferase [Nitrospiraceae bacterium]